METVYHYYALCRALNNRLPYQYFIRNLTVKWHNCHGTGFCCSQRDCFQLPRKIAIYANMFVSRHLVITCSPQRQTGLRDCLLYVALGFGSAVTLSQYFSGVGR